MSNDVSTILVSFGATVNEDSFKKSLSKLQAVLKMAAKEMSAKNKTKSDTYLSVALDDIAKLDKSLKSKIPQIKKEFQNLISTKDSEKNIEALIAKMHVLRAEAAAVAATVEASTSKKSKTGKGVSTDAATETSAYVAYKNKLDELYEKDLARSKFLRQAYKGTVGGVDKNHPENLSQLKLAAKEFAKYAEAEFKFSRSTGKEDWGNKASYSRVFEGINEKVIRFDRDLGFFTTSMAEGSKALSVTQEVLRKSQQKSIDGLAAVEKVLQMDKKSGTGRGQYAVNELKGVYGKDAAGADIYGGTLLQTMKMMQKPSFGSLGVGGDAASITNAAVQGNITLTTRGLKVNNEEGLKALKITEELAIKNGLLSKEYKGVGYDLQKLNAQYNRLSAEQQKAFAATGADTKNVASFKAGLSAVNKASADQVTSPDKSFDLATAAVKRFNGELEKTETKSQKAFKELYAGGTDKTREALDKVKNQYGEGSKHLDEYVQKLKKVEQAIVKTSLASGEDPNAKQSFYQLANREKMVDALGKQIKATGEGFTVLNRKMTESEKVMHKYRGETDEFKKALSEMLALKGASGQPFGRFMGYLNSASKKIEETKTKLNSMGKDGAEWAKQFDLTSIAKEGLSGSEGIKLQKEIDAVEKYFNKLHNTGGILRRGITDLYEKFKILAGYAISGAIAYGIGNAFKNAVGGVVQYDQALKDLQAITLSTEQQTKQMGEEIFRVATTTKFSVLELAEGMKILGQTGMNSQQAISALEPIAELATATLSDFATINDLVTTAMGAFDLDDDNVKRITDVFGAAINKSKLNVDKLRVAMNYVGPVASDAGLSIEEVAAAMGLFANSGLRASTIGTAFRQIISQLLSPSKEMQEAILLAGYSLDDVNPRINGFSNVIAKLVHIVPDAENAFKFFGQRGSSAVSVLTKEGTAGFEEMTKKMEMTGVVSEMAAKQMEGLQVMAKNLSDTMGVASIKMFQAFGVDDMIRSSISGAKSLITTLMELTGGFGEVIANIVMLGLAITGVTLLFKTLTTTIAVVNGVAITEMSIGLKVLTGSWAAFKATMIATAFTIGTFTVPIWAVIAAISALAIGIGTVVGVWLPWMSELDKAKETLAKQRVEVENNVKANDLLLESAKGLKDVIEDSKAPLKDRIQAYLSLKNAGAGLDDSISSNTDSVEDFDSALESSRGVINDYISKLEDLSEAYKKTKADIFVAESELAQAQIDQALEDMSKPGKYIAGSEKFGIFKEFTSEDRVNQVKEVDDAKAKQQEQKDLIIKWAEDYIEKNAEIKKRLTAAQASLNAEEVEKIYDEIIKGINAKTRIPINVLVSKSEDLKKDLLSYNAHERSWETIFQESMKKVENPVKNVSEERGVAESNIGRIAAGLEERKRLNKERLENLANELGKDSEEYKETFERFTASEREATETAIKDIDKEYGVIEKLVKDGVETFKLQREASLASLRGLKESGAISETEYETKKESVAVDIAQKEYDEFMRALDIVEATGLVSEKMQIKIDQTKMRLQANLQNAMADRAQGMKSIGERNDREREKDLRDSLKTLHDQYKVAKEKLEEEENAELARNRETNQFNEELAGQKEYEIKKKWGEEKLRLARQLLADERTIRDSGGKLTADKTGEIELSKLKQAETDRDAEFRMEAAQKLRNNLEEERNLKWEYRNLELQDQMDYYEQLKGLEELEHERTRTELNQRLLDGKITWDNYMRAQQNEQLRHKQATARIERQTNELRISNQAQLIGELAGMMGELYSISGEKAKGFFYAQKALTVTEMVMNAYKTWSNAMATPNVSPMFNIPMANIMLAMGLAKAGMVAGLSVAQGVKGFAEGGEIGGYSPTPTADNIPFWGTAGEFVQPVPTVDYYGKGIMEAMRTRSIPKEVFTGMAKSSHKSGGERFAEGGAIEGQQESGKSSSTENLQIVNVLDPGMFDQYMASHAGQKTLMNVISRNPQVIKNIVRD